VDNIIITQKRKKYKHILEKDRYAIETLLKAKVTLKEIAKQIDCNLRTLKREIKRGTVSQIDTELRCFTTYSAEFGQLQHQKAGANKGRYPKLNNNLELRQFMENKIKKEHFSPDAAIMQAKFEGIKVDISTKTVYNSIDRGDIDVTRKDLLRKEGWKQDKETGKIKPRQGHHTRGKSIDERPVEINNRTELGHYEGDLVVSKRGGTGAILTIVERKTREIIIIKLNSKEKIEVKKALDKLEKNGVKIHSITFDNGSEFLDFNALQTSISGEKRYEIYYAHPYSSWERGTNENHNGIVRRFFPKGTDFSKISQRRLTKVQNWMNNYPRRILGGLAPTYYAKLVA
jgi:IS30 family transposase